MCYFDNIESVVAAAEVAAVMNSTEQEEMRCALGTAMMLLFEQAVVSG